MGKMSKAKNLMARKLAAEGMMDATGIAAELGITKSQAAGIMSSVTKGPEVESSAAYKAAETRGQSHQKKEVSHESGKLFQKAE